LSEWKLFEGDVPVVSTREFHQHRERAAHLEQGHHSLRLYTAAGMIRAAARLFEDDYCTFSDLGCGDGGLLSLVQESFDDAWGYDFQPSNAKGWSDRRVRGYLKDVFNYREDVDLGTVVSCTEVLEHLADPHGVLKWLHEEDEPQVLVCSSPWNEGPGSHDECHAWAWDVSGYAAMVSNAGWTIEKHEQVGPFQVVKAVK
jgi:2-polyprenyl-3-methyl-5-hydroxy-6-metoxy-1,4-benzoquinol methylase